MLKLKIDNKKINDLYIQAKDNYLDKDYPDVITKSRTMLEYFFMDALEKHGYEDIDRVKGKVNKQFDELKQLYKDKFSNEEIINLIGSFTHIISTIAYIRNNGSNAHASIDEIVPTEINASLAELTLNSTVIVINFLEELNAKVLDAKKDEPKNNMLLSLPKPDFSKLVHDNDDVIAAMKHKNAIFQRNNIGSLLRANHNMESLILKNNIEMPKPILSTVIDSSKKEENTDNNINSNYYGLFIQSGKDFSKSGKAKMKWDRLFRTNEYTDERLLKMIYTDEGYISNDIINIPMIFGDEYIPSKSNQENNQLFYYGRLRNIEQNSKYVSIEYDILGNIPAEKMLHFSDKLDISDWEFHRTYWALKHVNAIKILGLDFSD